MASEEQFYYNGTNIDWQEIHQLRQIDPYSNILNIIQKQKDEEARRKNKKEEEENKIKPSILPPAIRIDEDLTTEVVAPKPLLPLDEVLPKTSESIAEKITKRQIPISILPKANESKPQNKKQNQVLEAKTPVGFLDVPAYPTDRPPKPPENIEVNRILEILQGKMDPIWGKGEYQQWIKYSTEMEELNKKAQESPEPQKTNIDWISQPDVDLETIKNGVASGELILRPMEYKKIEYYTKDPESGAVKKDYVEVPVGYNVYPLLPRIIEGKPYRVPAIKPAYYIDYKGNVRKYEEGVIKNVLRDIGTKTYGPTDWDAKLQALRNVITGQANYAITTGDAKSLVAPPQAPQNLLDAILGLSANLPYSQKTIFEPGGKPTSWGDYPIYKATQPVQKEINVNPYTWAQYGVLTPITPLTSLNVVFAPGSTAPQFPPAQPQLNIEYSKEELERFKQKIEKDEIWSQVFGVVSMLPMGLSRVLMGVMASSFATQPFATEPQRPLAHKVAESLLNLGLFYGVGRINKVGKLQAQGLPAPTRTFIGDIAKRTGFVAGIEGFRSVFTDPQTTNEDIWQTLKPYTYAIASQLAFEIFNVPGYIKYRANLKKNLPPELYDKYLKLSSSLKKGKPEEIVTKLDQEFKEMINNEDNPDERRAIMETYDAWNKGVAKAQEIKLNPEKTKEILDEVFNIPEEKTEPLEELKNQADEVFGIKQQPEARQEEAVAGEQTAVAPEIRQEDISGLPESLTQPTSEVAPSPSPTPETALPQMPIAESPAEPLVIPQPTVIHRPLEITGDGVIDVYNKLIGMDKLPYNFFDFVQRKLVKSKGDDIPEILTYVKKGIQDVALGQKPFEVFKKDVLDYLHPKIQERLNKLVEPTEQPQEIKPQTEIASVQPEKETSGTRPVISAEQAPVVEQPTPKYEPFPFDIDVIASEFNNILDAEGKYYKKGKIGDFILKFDKSINKISKSRYENKNELIKSLSALRKDLLKGKLKPEEFFEKVKDTIYPHASRSYEQALNELNKKEFSEQTVVAPKEEGQVSEKAKTETSETQPLTTEEPKPGAESKAVEQKQTTKAPTKQKKAKKSKEEEFTEEELQRIGEELEKKKRAREAAEAAAAKEETETKTTQKTTKTKKASKTKQETTETEVPKEPPKEAPSEKQPQVTDIDLQKRIAERFSKTKESFEEESERIYKNSKIEGEKAILPEDVTALIGNQEQKLIEVRYKGREKGKHKYEVIYEGPKRTEKKIDFENLDNITKFKLSKILSEITPQKFSRETENIKPTKQERPNRKSEEGDEDVSAGILYSSVVPGLPQAVEAVHKALRLTAKVLTRKKNKAGEGEEEIQEFESKKLPFTDAEIEKFYTPEIQGKIKNWLVELDIPENKKREIHEILLPPSKTLRFLETTNFEGTSKDFKEGLRNAFINDEYFQESNPKAKERIALLVNKVTSGSSTNLIDAINELKSEIYKSFGKAPHSTIQRRVEEAQKILNRLYKEPKAKAKSEKPDVYVPTKTERDYKLEELEKAAQEYFRQQRAEDDVFDHSEFMIDTEPEFRYSGNEYNRIIGNLTEGHIGDIINRTVNEVLAPAVSAEPQKRGYIKAKYFEKLYNNYILGRSDKELNRVLNKIVNRIKAESLDRFVDKLVQTYKIEDRDFVEKIAKWWAEDWVGRKGKIDYEDFSLFASRKRKELSEETGQYESIWSYAYAKGNEYLDLVTNFWKEYTKERPLIASNESILASPIFQKLLLDQMTFYKDILEINKRNLKIPKYVLDDMHALLNIGFKDPEFIHKMLQDKYPLLDATRIPPIDYIKAVERIDYWDVEPTNIPLEFKRPLYVDLPEQTWKSASEGSITTLAKQLGVEGKKALEQFSNYYYSVFREGLPHIEGDTRSFLVRIFSPQDPIETKVAKFIELAKQDYERMFGETLTGQWIEEFKSPVGIKLSKEFPNLISDANVILSEVIKDLVYGRILKPVTKERTDLKYVARLYEDLTKHNVDFIKMIDQTKELITRYKKKLQKEQLKGSKDLEEMVWDIGSLNQITSFLRENQFTQFSPLLKSEIKEKPKLETLDYLLNLGEQIDRDSLKDAYFIALKDKIPEYYKDTVLSYLKEMSEGGGKEVNVKQYQRLINLLEKAEQSISVEPKKFELIKKKKNYENVKIKDLPKDFQERFAEWLDDSLEMLYNIYTPELAKFKEDIYVTKTKQIETEDGGYRTIEIEEVGVDKIKNYKLGDIVEMFFNEERMQNALFDSIWSGLKSEKGFRPENVRLLQFQIKELTDILNRVGDFAVELKGTLEKYPDLKEIYTNPQEYAGAKENLINDIINLTNKYFKDLDKYIWDIVELKQYPLWEKFNQTINYLDNLVDFIEPNRLKFGEKKLIDDEYYPVLKELIKDEFLYNPDLRRKYIMDNLDSGWPIEDIYKKLKLINPEIKRKTVFEDLKEIGKQYEAIAEAKKKEADEEFLDETLQKEFDEAELNDPEFQKLLKEVIGDATDLNEITDLEKSTDENFYFHPSVLLPAVGIIGQYIIPDDQKEVKDILLGASLGGFAAYWGYKLYKNYKALNRFRPMPEEGLTFAIKNAPIIQEAKERNISKQELVNLVEKVINIHRLANKVTGAPLVIQAKKNELMRKIYDDFKEIELRNNEKHFEFKKRYNEFFKKFTSEELGLISKIAIRTQRGLYQIRRREALEGRKILKPEERATYKDKLIEQYTAEEIIKNKVKFRGAKNLEEYKKKIIDGIKEYRAIMGDITELHYRVEAAKRLGIPVSEQTRVYEENKIKLEGIKSQQKAEIDYFKKTLRSYKQAFKNNLKELDEELRGRFQSVIKEEVPVLLKDPKILSLIKKGFDLEAIIESPLFDQKIAAKLKRSKEFKELIRDFKGSFKQIQRQIEVYAKFKAKLKEKQKIMNAEIKALKQIQRILDPQSIAKYKARSENEIFWNNLWDRTFGDYGVKVESYLHRNGEPQGPEDEYLAKTKMVFYDQNAKAAMGKALEFLEREGYQKHPEYSDIWVYKGNDGAIKDVVRVVGFNRKILDYEKVHVNKLVDDLRTYYYGIAKAYKQLAATRVLGSQDYSLLNEFKNKLAEILKISEKTDIDETLSEHGLDLNWIRNLINKQEWESTDLGKLLSILRATEGTIPPLKYRDYAGYETSEDLAKEGALFKYANLALIDKMRERGMQNEIIAKINGTIEPMILNYNLMHTPFENYITELKKDLLFTPTDLYQKGLIKIGKKVFDYERLINNLSSLAFFPVFFANISAAYRNNKYFLIANQVNMISQEGKPLQSFADLIKMGPMGFLDFVQYTKNKLKKKSEIPPLISRDDNVKQIVFEKLYKAGVFSQSVLDALAASTSTINIKDWVNLPIPKTELAKLLMFKFGFALQRNSEVLNKLISFEIRYNALRRAGINDVTDLTREIIRGIGEDVGFYQVHDLGNLTRWFGKHPLTRLALHMLKPSIIQNYNYLETLKVPYQYIKEKIKGEPFPSYDEQTVLNHIKALGALSVLITLMGGWKGVPFLGDIIQNLDDLADKISKGDKDFDPRGLEKLKLQLKQLAKEGVGMDPNTFDKYWLALQYGVDSYLTGRNLSVDNLLGPYVQPFLLDFYNRTLTDLAKAAGGKTGIIDILQPTGIKKLVDYFKTITSGQILTKGKFIDVKTGRSVALRDYLFGFLGNSLIDTELRYLDAKGYYDFYTKQGRKDFIKKQLDLITMGPQSTRTMSEILDELAASDPEFLRAQDVYLTALDIYKNKYIDYVAETKEKLLREIKENKDKFVDFYREMKDKEFIYGKPEGFDRFTSTILDNAANYYQMLAIDEAFDIVYGRPIGNSEIIDFKFGLDEYSIKDRGYRFAIQKLMNSKEIRKDEEKQEELEEIFE